MRLVPLHQERTVTAGMAGMNQPGLFFDGLHPSGQFLPTDGDAWLLNGYTVSSRPWPMELYGFTVRILTATRNPRTGWHLKLVALIDGWHYLVLNEGIQSALSAVQWTGRMPLEWGFGVVMNAQLTATDRISVNALYGVPDGRD